MPFFEVNGLLGIYPMHLVSTSHWKYLFPNSPNSSNNPGDPEKRGEKEGFIALDVGAGVGDVTSYLQPLCTELHCK